jgi:primosomal protein N' (replication factor Y)
LTQVLVHTPVHSQMAGALSYWSATPLPPGTLVRVPLGQRELLGVVWPDGSASTAEAALDPAKLRPVTAALDALPPLSPHWRALISFAASYYQRAAGEVALAALPPQLRDMSSVQLGRRLKKLAKAAKTPVNPADSAGAESASALTSDSGPAAPAVVLTQEQI